MPQDTLFKVYTYSEGRTGTGELIRFSCAPEDVQEIKKFLETKVRSLDIPTTGRVNIGHGAYGRYTRYDITQHGYVGARSGYIETLEITDPPDGRCGHIVHRYSSYGDNWFMEWKSLEQAKAAFERCWSVGDKLEAVFASQPGFIRRVDCRGGLTPWFYVIGTQLLIRDYTFPEYLQDDPVFQCGRQFVVRDPKGFMTIKTCLGAETVRRRDYYHPYWSDYRTYDHRVIYWDDGTVWDEKYDRAEPPRPAHEGELWIVEAITRFRQLLSGRLNSFKIQFTDGLCFVGKLVASKERRHTEPGRYWVRVKIRGQAKIRQGWHEFTPTADFPDIVSSLTHEFSRRGGTVERIEITKYQSEDQAKKRWSGIYHDRNTPFECL